MQISIFTFSSNGTKFCFLVSQPVLSHIYHLPRDGCCYLLLSVCVFVFYWIYVSQKLVTKMMSLYLYVELGNALLETVRESNIP